ncbi:glycosyltransferase [Shewanella sp. DW31]|uniref:glycosyltransferase n=1 Tax=Shewanella sp. DW31 TaxID=2699422 RepID=UPI0018E3691F|nr:glycosyltransferase [Shewanella sp. DW31]MBI1674394.1 glycosyltransferase [Shewanella sp. DW31]
MNSCAISVVTITFNCQEKVEGTLKSVLRQDSQAFEYVIVDGGSTDGTYEKIKEYSCKFKNRGINLIHCSERDHGIYDALNKAIGMCSGQWIICVMAGDFLYENSTLSKFFLEFKSSNVDIVYGDSEYYTNGITKRLPAIDDVVQNLWKGPLFRQGSMFVSRDVYNHNHYKVTHDLRIAADFDFIFDMFVQGKKFAKFNNVITVFELDGVSNDGVRQVMDNKLIVSKYLNGLNKKQAFYYRKVLLKQKILNLTERLKLLKIYRQIRSFFEHYVCNHIVNKIPFYSIRHFFYRKIKGVLIGSRSSIHLNTFIDSVNVSLGNNSTIGRSTYLDGRGGLVIGDNVSISPRVNIITAQHHVNCEFFSNEIKRVKINDYVWIGTGAIILPGVELGRGAVVAAGAVVSKDVGEFNIVAGNPARLIGTRNKNLVYSATWLKGFD